MTHQKTNSRGFDAIHLWIRYSCFSPNEDRRRERLVRRRPSLILQQQSDFWWLRDWLLDFRTGGKRLMLPNSTCLPLPANQPISPFLGRSGRVLDRYYGMNVIFNGWK